MGFVRIIQARREPAGQVRLVRAETVAIETLVTMRQAFKPVDLAPVAGLGHDQTAGAFEIGISLSPQVYGPQTQLPD